MKRNGLNLIHVAGGVPRRIQMRVCANQAPSHGSECHSSGRGGGGARGGSSAGFHVRPPGGGAGLQSPQAACQQLAGRCNTEQQQVSCLVLMLSLLCFGCWRCLALEAHAHVRAIHKSEPCSQLTVHISRSRRQVHALALQLVSGWHRGSAARAGIVQPSIAGALIYCGSQPCVCRSVILA